MPCSYWKRTCTCTCTWILLNSWLKFQVRLQTYLVYLGVTFGTQYMEGYWLVLKKSSGCSKEHQRPEWAYSPASDWPTVFYQCLGNVYGSRWWAEETVVHEPRWDIKCFANTGTSLLQEQHFEQQNASLNLAVFYAPPAMYLWNIDEHRMCMYNFIYI